MLTLAKPTIRQVAQGLLSVIATDANAGVSSLINTTIATYGVSLDGTTASAVDAGKLKFIKLGSRGAVPAGLSVMVFHLTEDPEWYTSPNGMKTDLHFAIQAYWDDTAALKLTATPDTINELFYDLTEAMRKVVNPANLANAGGYWDVTGAGDFVGDPRVKTASSYSFLDDPKVLRNQVLHYNSLQWAAFRMEYNP